MARISSPLSESNRLTPKLDHLQHGTGVPSQSFYLHGNSRLFGRRIVRIRNIVIAAASALAVAGCAYDDYGYGYGDRYYGDRYYNDAYNNGYYRDYGSSYGYRDDGYYQDRDDYGYYPH